MKYGTSEMSQWVKVLDTKLDKLTWIPRTHRRGKNQLAQLVL